VRALVLSIREEPYVEAALALGTPTAKIMFGHICPNTAAPLIVQGTYIVAFAILVEAALSFLGVGLPPDIPTGQHHGRGPRAVRLLPAQRVLPWHILALTVLAVNILGDGLRTRSTRRWRSAYERPRHFHLTIALPSGADRAQAVSNVSFGVEKRRDSLPRRPSRGPARASSRSRSWDSCKDAPAVCRQDRARGRRPDGGAARRGCASCAARAWRMIFQEPMTALIRS